MMKWILLFSMFIFNVNAFAGGCIVLNNPTATSGTAYATCQAYMNQVTCDANPTCKWNVIQYFKNNCSGEVAFQAPCPAGTAEVSFNPGTDSNPKFKCCKTQSNPTPTATCCNPGGNPVPAMVPCPTANQPYRCCNPSGSPVRPMLAATNQCTGKFGKGLPGKVRR